MSWRLRWPRRIGAYEVQILQRLLQVGTDSPPSQALMASIENLIVQEEGCGGFQHDSLDFDSVRAGGKIIASAIGRMANGAQVELILWARGDIITYLELEPFEGALRPIRMPILESIRPYPDDTFGSDETGNDDEIAHDLAAGDLSQ
jgi:hypothetical protein